MSPDRLAPSYPPLDAPAELLDADDWSLAQAREFLDWTKRVMVPRSDALLAYLGISPISSSASPGEHYDMLQHVGARVAEVVHDPQFWHHVDRPVHPVYGTGDYSGPDLNDVGLSLAGDVALLLARVVLTDLSPPLKWGIERGKTMYNRNLPILTGFKHRWADYSPFTYGQLGTQRLLQHAPPETDYFADRYRRTRSNVLNPDDKGG